MAWNLKYYGEWYDFGKSSTSTRNRLEIYVPTTVSSPSEVTVRGLKINQPAINLYTEGECTIGMGLDMFLISEQPLDFLDVFYTIDPLGVQVRYYHDYSSSSSTPFFVGYVDTEQYSDPISERLNYEMNITANNGFTVLERFPLLDASGGKLTGLWSLMDLIDFCLKKLTIDYDYYNIGLYTRIHKIDSSINTALYTNYYGDTVTNANGEGVLHECMVNVDNYYDEDENEMTCREVLNSLLLPFGCKMYAYNNQIYILDLYNLAKTPVNAYQYNFSDLVYQSLVSVQSGVSAISRRLEQHSVDMVPGKRKVSVNFNKYVLSNPIDIEVSEKTMSGYLTQEDYTVPDGMSNEYIKEFHYSDCENIVKMNRPSNVRFIKKKGPGMQDNSETFMRFYPDDSTDSSPYWAVRINTGIYVHSSKMQFFGLSGQVKADKLSDYDNESTISVTQSFLPLIARFGLSYEKTGFYPMINDMYHNKEDGQTYWVTGQVLTPSSDRTDTPVINLREYNGGFKYNKWYELNGNSYTRTYWTGSYKTFNSPIFPLKNWGQNDDTSIQGGYLFIEFYVPKSGDTTLTDTDNEWWCDNFLGMSIKNLKVHILELTEPDGLYYFEQYKNVEALDAEYQVESDNNYRNTLTVSTQTGTDLKTMCRGALYFNKKYEGTGDIYYDCDASILNYQHEIEHERVVRVKYFERGQNGGYLEDLLLNTYMSNLQQSRYKFTVNLKGIHYVPVQKFQFSLLQRDGTMVNLIPVSLEYDCVEDRTQFELEEIIQEEQNQLTINE